MKRGVDYIGVGIGAALVNAEGKVFLSQRGPNAQNERGKWECPGGALEFGHTFEDTIIREMQEEYGISVAIVDSLAPFNHLIPNEKQHWVGIAFVCILKQGTPRILEPEKCTAIGWFTLAEMARMDLALTAKHRLQQLCEKYPNGIPNLYAHPTES
jgi:mutator protein MutT